MLDSWSQVFGNSCPWGNCFHPRGVLTIVQGKTWQICVHTIVHNRSVYYRGRFGKPQRRFCTCVYTRDLQLFSLSAFHKNKFHICRHRQELFTSLQLKIQESSYNLKEPYNQSNAASMPLVPLVSKYTRYMNFIFHCRSVPMSETSLLTNSCWRRQITCFTLLYIIDSFHCWSVSVLTYSCWRRQITGFTAEHSNICTKP